MENSTSAGVDGIYKNSLRFVVPEVEKCLSIFFSDIFTYNKLPNCFQRANIVALLKPQNLLSDFPVIVRCQTQKQRHSKLYTFFKTVANLDSMRTVSGALKRTLQEWLPNLSNTAPPKNRRRHALLRGYDKILSNSLPPLHEDIRQ